jgi:hypothetical protein
MDNLIGIVRRVEDSMNQMNIDVRGVGTKHCELAKQVTESSAGLEDMHAKIESLLVDNHALKDDLRNNEARMEVWQKDLRELRRSQLGIAPKFEEKTGRQQPSSSQGCRGGNPTDTWPQTKKSILSSASVEGSANQCCSTPESGDGDNPKHKRMGRVNSASRRGLLQPELKLGSLPSRSSSQAVLYESIHASPMEAEDSIFSSHASSAQQDETTPSSRLPLLAKQPSGTRPPEGAYHSGLRLRFSETLARQPSRGSLN